MKTNFLNKIAQISTSKVLYTICFIGTFCSNINAGGPMLLRIDASGNDMQSETTIYFSPNGSLNYDTAMDSRSLGTDPGYLNIVSVFDDVDCAIKGLPTLNQNMSIPLKITTGSLGLYQIEGNEIKNLPAGACLNLHDNLTNTDFNLRSGPYSFTMNDTESAGRFVLNINITVVSISTGAFDPTCSASGDGMITVSMPAGSGSWTYCWKDSLNNIVKTISPNTDGDTLSGLNAGLYRVDVSTTGACLSGTSDYILQGQFTPHSLFSVTTDSVDLDTPVEFWNNSITADSYWWDFGDGEGSDDTNAVHQYASPGVFTAKLIAINAYCGDSAVQAIEITVTNNETTAVNHNTNESEQLHISRDEQGYYVTFSGKTVRKAFVSVQDILGNKVVADIESITNKNEKLRVALPEGLQNQLLIISVVTDQNEKAFKKIIN